MTRPALDVKTFAQANADLAAVLDTATAGGRPVIIAREDGEPVVLVPLSVWDALYGDEPNAAPESSQSLDEAIAELDAGGGVEMELGPEGFYIRVRKVAAA